MASTINAKNTSTGVVITPDASGQLELQTADTTRMTIDVNGNVGIGTSSPGSKLDVNGEIRIYPSSGTGNLRFGSAGVETGKVAVTSTNIMFFETNGSERMRIDSSGYVTNAVNGLGNGIVQAQQYYRLNSGLAGANVNTAQSIFGVGVTLVSSTVYEFEMVVSFTKTAGTTSHTLGFGFGGTATLNNIYYQAIGGDTSGGLTMVPGATVLTWGASQSASNTVFTRAITNASEFITAIIKGTVSVNAGGTFIPQYTLSAAPGGAYTTSAGSYIKISPLSSSGSNTSIGSWA